MSDEEVADSGAEAIESEDPGAGKDERRGRGGPDRRGRSRSTDRMERPKVDLSVSVENNIDKAMKILKRKMIKEGIFKELKLRRYYEKPSEKKKRKVKESIKKIRKEEARSKKNPFF